MNRMEEKFGAQAVPEPSHHASRTGSFHHINWQVLFIVELYSELVA